MENQNILDDNNLIDDDEIKCSYEIIQEVLRNITIDRCKRELSPDLQEKTELDINYLGINNINYDINYHTNFIGQGQIYLCVYQLNKVHVDYPFLQFFMLKGNQLHKTCADVFDFPSFSFTCGDNVYEMCNTLMKMMKMCYWGQLNYEYKGFIIHNNNCYVFMENITLIDSYKINRNDDLWIVMPDEIMNSNEVCGFKIRKHIIHFFNKYPNCLKLVNKENKMYESPVVAYSCVSSEQLVFQGIFGQSRSSDTTLIGPYYYFTDYKHSTALAPKCDKKGIIRFALFLGDMKVIETDNSNLETILDDCDSVFFIKNDVKYWVIDDFYRQSVVSYHNIPYDFDEKYMIS